MLLILAVVKQFPQLCLNSAIETCKLDEWLVVSNIFYFPYYICDNPSHWLICFKMVKHVKTTNQNFMPFFPVSLTQQLKIRALRGSLYIFWQCHIWWLGAGPQIVQWMRHLFTWEQRVSYWLVVWNIFILPYIGNNHPNWLILFGGVETTNQVRVPQLWRIPRQLQPQSQLCLWLYIYMLLSFHKWGL